MGAERVERSETIFQGRLLLVRRDEVVLPDGSHSIREVVHHPGAVAILPVQDDGRVVLVQQYRHAVRRMLLEVPAGTREPHETPEACAARELEEETGYRATEMRLLTRFFVSPGWTDEELSVYVAEGLERGTPRPARDERVKVVILSPDEAYDAVRRGDICDAKSVVALLAFFGWKLV